MRDILGCKLSGIEIVDALSFYEQITGKLLVEKMHPSWFIFSNGSRVTPFTRFTKRVFDLFFATVGLILIAPVIPFIALAVKLDSPGPVFFRQMRVGKGEKNFVLYKFRTMCKDAEKGTGAVWARENDPRVTRIGKFLRTTRLDEVPQLFNVLRGDMSFVGPRPERPEFVSDLKEKIPYYSNRHYVKPGATGWAQVKYPYGASVEDAEEKLCYDLYYIKNFSLVLDFMIILETVKVVVFGRGAR
jgi:sugar transferase (PEP-CTERM system associated)